MRELPPEVRVLVGVAFMVALGFGLVLPAIPLFARQFGVGKTAAGAVISAFALTRLIAAPFVGRIVNAVGERVILATGIGIVALSSLLSGLAQAYWQLLVLRGAGGIGSIMFSVASASLLIRVTPSHQRGRAQGVWAGSFLLGSIAGMPQWVLDIDPYSHLPKLPSAPFTATPVVVLVVIAAVLAGIGLVAFRRRDLR